MRFLKYAIPIVLSANIIHAAGLAIVEDGHIITVAPTVSTTVEAVAQDNGGWISAKIKGTLRLQADLLSSEDVTATVAAGAFAEAGVTPPGEIMAGIATAPVEIENTELVAEPAQEPEPEPTLPPEPKPEPEPEDDGSQQVADALSACKTIRFRNITFEVGRATLTADGRAYVATIAGGLRENPKLSVELHGHTDSQGSDAYNQQLSMSRADAVRTALVTVHGIDPSRLKAIGYGEAKPIEDNDTSAGRERNRRVEIVNANCA